MKIKAKIRFEEGVICDELVIYYDKYYALPPYHKIILLSSCYEEIYDNFLKKCENLLTSGELEMSIRKCIVKDLTDKNTIIKNCTTQQEKIKKINKLTKKKFVFEINEDEI